MSFDRWPPYVSVAERRKRAEKVAAKAKKSGATLTPVEPYRGAIAKTFWGKAWCDNLHAYSDYANRLPRGASYVRNGSVIDLVIGKSEIRAQVMGSSLYKIVIKVKAVPTTLWQAISADCAGSIDTLVELLQGQLSTAVMQRICAPRTGLFPAPKEIGFSCSCPDSAYLCKHIAAALYGVGARLDQQPELLFRLRGVEPKELVSQAGTGLAKTKTAASSKLPAGKVLADASLADVFGIELDESILPTPGLSRSRKSSAPASVKTSSVNKVEAKKQPAARRKAVAVKTPPTAKPAAKKVAAKAATKVAAKVTVAPAKATVRPVVAGKAKRAVTGAVKKLAKRTAGKTATQTLVKTPLKKQSSVKGK